jgi:hypothetical protein
MGLPWDDRKAQGSAQEMFERMWQFKFTPPGRGLWMMGTDLIYNKGGAALNNCAFVTTANIDIDFAAPFCFLMDMSMFGVGVGSDTKGVGKVRISNPEISGEVFVVDDSREGWVELLSVVLNAYAGRARLPKFIDYSEVREMGSPIKGFGGVACRQSQKCTTSRRLPTLLYNFYRNCRHIQLCWKVCSKWWCKKNCRDNVWRFQRQRVYRTKAR